MKTALLSASLVALFCATMPSYAVTDAECAKAWADADAKKAGMLTETEAPRYFGALHFANKTIDAKGLSQEQFVTYCKEGVFDVTPAAAGAPFKGANSFTEGQARNRAAAYGYIVPSMTKDADGIWRGQVNKDGKTTSVAVDYKGNVVAN